MLRRIWCPETGVVAGAVFDNLCRLPHFAHSFLAFLPRTNEMYVLLAAARFSAVLCVIGCDSVRTMRCLLSTSWKARNAVK